MPNNNNKLQLLSLPHWKTDPARHLPATQAEDVVEAEAEGEPTIPTPVLKGSNGSTGATLVESPSTTTLRTAGTNTNGKATTITSLPPKTTHREATSAATTSGIVGLIQSPREAMIPPPAPAEGVGERS